LQELRRRWQARRREAPLFDTDRCRRHLESAFERMWRLNELGKKPESFAVNAAG
jgi:predicted O-linked N-acetylglucosamine transferase (SPINDLY family)